MRLARMVLASALVSTPLAAIDCSTVVGNLVTSCGFESAPEVAAWTLTDGDSDAFAAGQGQNGGAVTVNSALVSTPIEAMGLNSPCFPVSAGAAYHGGYVARAAVGQSFECDVEIREYSDIACGVLNASNSSPAFLPVNDAAFTDIQFAFITNASAHSARLRISCFGTSEFDLLADNAFVVLQPSVIEVPALDGRGLALLIGALMLAGAILLGRR